MTLRIVNPATLQIVAELEGDTPLDIDRKLAQARSAQSAWRATPLERRLQAISRFRDLLLRDARKLAETLTRETGKPLKQALHELAAMPERIDFFLKHVGSVLADEIVAQGPTEERIVWEPLGVIANISAWNYPYFVGSNVFVPALLAGNAVLYKPSEHATLTGLAIAELLYEAGIPEDVFIVVSGAGKVGAELVARDIDAVFFTGSVATGRTIAQSAAGRMMKVQLELGGKAPTYVCDDADPGAAAKSLADGAMYNTGQSCCSVERIYVHKQMAQAFVSTFVETVKGFVMGDPMDESTYIGPLAREPQLRVLARQVEDALSKGAKVLVGGRRSARPGNYFDPTVLVDVDHRMQVMREESFGPIIGIQVVGDDAEAVRLMNDTVYGLTAGVYTRDAVRAKRILSQVDVGTAYWNCCDRVSPRLPWTGRKGSGIGSTLSTHGIRTFLLPKAWHLRSVL
jgi:acyl-CoA reductase-like NAD-dependent aldehyde dehydrogenase